MKCDGCGNKDAVRVIYVCGHGETCEKCAGHRIGLGKEKTTGFMFNGKLLKKNSNKKLAKQVRQEYRGDDIDSARGRDF